MGGFEQAAALGAGAEQRQNDLRRAVDSGELWMEAGVAERAAQRCEQTVVEINQWLSRADRLIERLPFGDNHDGVAVAERYAQAGQEFINEMTRARTVIENMAATYRAAGRTVAAADEAGQQSFQGRSE
ncbi:MAG TPA: hypothetical protein VHH34_01835 [Pseudonocardiaceae bacterium]|nr:hypothetical protein [Pseudonocardiaceae bacterium]